MLWNSTHAYHGWVTHKDLENAPGTDQKERQEKLRYLQARYDAFYQSKDFAHFGHELHYIRFLVSHLSSWQQSRGWILDVGCGAGHYTSLFGTLGLNSCGVDLSDVAKKRALQRAPNIHVCQADATSLPFKPFAFSSARRPRRPPHTSATTPLIRHPSSSASWPNVPATISVSRPPAPLGSTW